MELLGRPPPAYGLKFLVKAGSPDPVMTRHWWPAVVEPAPSVAAGAAALPRSAAVAARPAAAAVANQRGRMLRRIGCPFSPGVGRLIFTRGPKMFRKRLPRIRPQSQGQGDSSAS